MDPGPQVKEKADTEIPSKDSNSGMVDTEPTAEVLSKEPKVTKEAEAKQGEQDDKEKGDAEDDMGEIKVGKRRHLITEILLFPMFFTMFGFRAIAGTVNFILGVLLMVAGSWLNSGEFGLEAVASKPFPDIEVEDMKSQQNILHSCALIGWILGFFMILNSLYNVWTFMALGSIIFDKLPWARDRWNQARVAADEYLSSVREESMVDQFHRMNKSQIESMAKHDERRRDREKKAETA